MCVYRVPVAGSTHILSGYYICSVISWLLGGSRFFTQPSALVPGIWVSACSSPVLWSHEVEPWPIGSQRGVYKRVQAARRLWYSWGYSQALSSACTQERHLILYKEYTQGMYWMLLFITLSLELLGIVHYMCLCLGLVWCMSQTWSFIYSEETAVQHMWLYNRQQFLMHVHEWDFSKAMA